MHTRMTRRMRRAFARRRVWTAAVAVTAVPALVVVPAAVAGAATAAPVAAASSLTTTPMTSALAAQLSKNVNKSVIVILKSQLAQKAVGSAAESQRGQATLADQKPLITELGQVHATHVRQFKTVNSFAATVSAGEETRLKANPAVAQVIPNATINVSLDGPDSTAAAAAAIGHSQVGQGLGRHADPERDPRRLQHQAAAGARGTVADPEPRPTARPRRRPRRSASPARA